MQARWLGRPTWITSGTKGDEVPGHEGSRPMFIPTVLHNLCNKIALEGMTSPPVIWETQQSCNTEGSNEAGGHHGEETAITWPVFHCMFHLQRWNITQGLMPLTFGRCIYKRECYLPHVSLRAGKPCKALRMGLAGELGQENPPPCSPEALPPGSSRGLGHRQSPSDLQPNAS